MKIIVFEEKDREKIEQTGMTIIQTKRVLYKFRNLVQDVWEQLKKYVSSLDSEQKEKFFEFLKNDNGDYD